MTKTTGVLLINLGTPDAPTPKAVKRYLAEFLSDPRVVTLPRWLWLPILHGVILPLRSRRSAEMYQKIWLPQGSPLRVYSQQLAQQLQAQSPHLQVELGMCYGSPSIADALAKLKTDTIIVIPLYPQYASSSTGAALSAVMSYFKKQIFIPELKIISHYADNPAYIAAIAESISEHWQQHGRAQKILFSFHGIRQKSIQEGDPYDSQCKITAKLLAQKLNLAEHEWELVFQSRFGREAWLQPYCDQRLKQLPSEGIKTLDIICPGFTVDCLETLEEIAITNKNIFLTHGGQQYNYIPCLNTKASKTLSTILPLPSRERSAARSADG